MIRTFAINLFLLLLPLGIYAAYLTFVLRKRATQGADWNDAPITLLLVAGVLLVIASIFYFSLQDGTAPQGRWSPETRQDSGVFPQFNRPTDETD